MDNNSLEIMNQIYASAPEYFTEDEVNYLEKANYANGYKFQRNQEAGGFNLINTASQLVTGFMSGFTTFDIGDKPKNTAEQIARGIGELAGFVGIIPGLGSIGKLAGMAVGSAAKGLRVLRGLEVAKDTLGIVELGARTSKVIGNLNKFTSVPMYVADLIMKRVGVENAAKMAGTFLHDTVKLSRKINAGKIIESGLHLGFASATSSWQGGIDNIMNSFLHGFEAGSVFGIAGELLPSETALPQSGSIFKKFMSQVKTPAGELDKKGLARVLSTSLYMGIPNTVGKAPLEIQVYNYLLGGYFGINSISNNQKEALEFINKKRDKLPNDYIADYALSNVEELEGYTDLDKEVQKEVSKQIDLMNIRTLKIGKESNMFQVGKGGAELARVLDELKQKKIEEIDKSNMNEVEKTNAKTNILREYISVIAAHTFEERVNELREDRKNELEKGLITEDDLEAEIAKQAMKDTFDELAKKTNEHIKEVDIQSKENIKRFIDERIIDTFGDEVSQKLLEEYDSYQDEFSEHLRPFRRTLDDIADLAIKKIYKKNNKKYKIDSTSINEGLKAKIFLSKLLVKELKKDEPDYQTYLDNVKEKLIEIEDNSELEKSLRRMWERYRQSEIIPQAIINLDNGLTIEPIERGILKENEKDITQYKAKPFLQERLEKFFGEKKRYFNIKYFKSRNKIDKVYNGIDIDNIAEIRKKLHENGYTIIFGAKDNSNIIVGEYVIKDDDVKGIMDTILAEAEKAGKKEEFEKTLTELEKDSGLSHKIFIKQYANNWKVLQSINNINDFGEFVRGTITGKYFKDPSKGIDYLIDPIKLNKRISLYDNGFLRLDPKVFKGTDAEHGLNTIITESIIRHKDGTKALTYWAEEDGKIVEKEYDEHTDGVAYIRDDIFDLFAKSAGLDREVGAHKGTLTYEGNGSNGALFGKLAWHRAGEAMSKAMREHDLHVMLNDTSAKQIGKRKVYKAYWTKDGRLEFGEKPKGYRDKTIKELKAILKEKGITGYSKLKKEELVKAIEKYEKDKTKKKEIDKLEFSEINPVNKKKDYKELFLIRLGVVGNEVLHKIYGKPVKYDNIDGEFYVTRTQDNKNKKSYLYRIVEKNTGLKIGKYGSTEKKAIEEGRKALENISQEKFDKVVEDSLKDDIYKQIKSFQSAEKGKEILVKKRIPMKFGDGTGGRSMRPEFKGKSTMDLVLSGDRTATTRDITKDYNKHDLKEGDVIEFYDSKGRTVKVVVTKASYPISQVSAEEWSKLEGWDKSLYNEIKKKKGQYEQFQFKLLNDTSEPIISKESGNIKKKETKFKGYKGGYDRKGKGTKEGDGKDKAMRKVADGVIVELARGSKNTSSETSAVEISEKLGDRPVDISKSNEPYETVVNYAQIGDAKIIMLARNGKLKYKPLQDTTKDWIKKMHEKGAKFVVGDYQDVDSQYVDYLQEIGAEFTIYHTGSRSRITVKEPIETNVITPISKESGLQSTTDTLKRKSELLVESEVIPHTAFTMTEIGEHIHNRRISYAAQFFSSMDDRFSKETKDWAKSLSKKALEGDKKTNYIISNWLKGKKELTDEEQEQIDLDNVGAQTKIDILYNSKNNSILYKRLVKRYLKRYLEDDGADASLDGSVSEAKIFQKAVNGESRDIERLFYVLQNEISPAMMNNVLFKRYFDKIVENGIRKEIIKPLVGYRMVDGKRVEAGFQSVFMPYRPDLMNKIKLNKGEVLLSRDAFKRYGIKIGDEIVVQRTPTDSASGVRVVKVIGVNDLPGQGIVLHPYDMQYLGGADLDIDKGFIYTDIPDYVKNDFKKVSKEWEKEIKDSKGNIRSVYKDSKENDAFIKKDTETIEKSKDKESKKNIEEKNKRNIINNVFAIADSTQMIKANKMAYDGRELLSPGIGGTKVILAELLDKNSKLKKVDNALNIFRELKRTLINNAADASDGINLMNKKEMWEKLITSLFKDTKERKKYIKNNIFNNKYYTIEDISKGRGTEIENGVFRRKTLTLDEVITEMKKLDIDSAELPSYDMALTLKELNMPDNVLSYLGGNYVENGKKINNLKNSNTEQMRISGRQKLQSYTVPSKNRLPDKDRLTENKYQNLISELVSQNIMDLVSLKMVAKYAPKDYDLNTVDFLREKAWKIKDKIREAIKNDDNTSREEAIKEYNSLKLNTPEPYRQLLDAFMLSSIRPQPLIGSPEYKQKKIALERAMRKENKNVSDKAIEKEFNKQWMDTNIDSFAWQIKTIDPKVIQGFMEEYNNIGQAIKKDKLSDEEVKLIDSYSKNDMYSKENIEIPTRYEVSREFAEKAHIYKLADREEDKELDEATEKVKLFLEKNPEYIKMIGGLFAGDSYRRLMEANIIPEIVSPELATRQAYIDFANSLEVIQKNREKGLELKRRHYFMPQSTIGRKHLPYDAIAYVTEAPIKINGNKTVMGEIIPFQTTMTKIYNIANKAGLALDNFISEIQNRANMKDSWLIDIAKIMEKQLNRTERGLGTLLWKIMVAKRELKRGISVRPLRLGSEEEVYSSKEIRNAIKHTLYSKMLPKKEVEKFYNAIENGKKYKIKVKKLDRAQDVGLDGYSELMVYVNENGETKFYKRLLTEKKVKGKKILYEELIPLKNKKVTVTDVYEKRWNEYKDKYIKLVKENKKYYIPKLGKELTIKEILKYYDDSVTDWVKRSYNKYIVSPEEKKFLLKYKNIVDSQTGLVNLDLLQKALTKEIMTGKTNILGENFINKIYHTMKFENMNKYKTLDIFNMLYAEKGSKFKSLSDIVSTGILDKLEGKGGIERLLIHNIKNNINEFNIKDIDSFQSRKWLLLKFHGDNIKKYMDKVEWNIKDVEDSIKSYYPHMNYDNTIVREWMADEMKKVKLEGGRNVLLDKIKLEASVMDLNDESGNDLINETTEVFEGKYDTGSKQYMPEDIAVQMEDIRIRTGNTMMRSRENPIPGWDISSDVIESYERKFIRTNINSLISYVNTRSIRRLEKGIWDIKEQKYKKSLGDRTDEWAKFGYIYNRDIVGRPSMFPIEWLNNEKYKIKNNPYYYLTDEYAKRLMEKISKKYFRGKKFAGRLNITLDEYRALDDNVKREIDKYIRDDMSRKLNWVARMDAKWNLISLLTHTKTFINNIIGGTENTIASVGLSNWKKAGDYNYMLDNLFVDFKSKEDILRFVEIHGGVESYFKSELSLNSKNATGDLKSFWEDVKDKYLTEPKYKYGFTDKELKDILKKHGITHGIDKIIDSSAWFMRKSEVMLRSRSWLAHYISARNALEATGMILEKDHPFIIDMANRGVESTQFLYNNANRPAFARTNLGKIYSRFQLWAWNSFKLRKDYGKAIVDLGYKPNSKESERFKRLMSMDLFIMSLATLFASSIFDSTLAPPLSYMQDISDFFFGDSRERNRAFYGSLPYPFNAIQAISPPSSRVPYSIFNLMVTGDWDKFTNNLYSWIPYGRSIKSIGKTIDSPAMVVENFTSIPIHRIGQYRKKIREGKKHKVFYNNFNLFN